MRQAKVLETIRIAADDGVTDAQLARFLRWPENSIRPRRIELVKLGLIEPAGKRKTASGRWAVTWRCTEKGQNL